MLYYHARKHHSDCLLLVNLVAKELLVHVGLDLRYAR
jgi:hypothetical protein